MTKSPLQDLFERHDQPLLDGGLATELERRGHRLDDRLWSARLIDAAPAAIRETHTAYLDAGANCIITASYQASIDGFGQLGLSRAESISRLECATVIACEARAGTDALVAASIGPYAAFLADGSEYRGHYALDRSALKTWHRERFKILAESGADLLACETIPNQNEALALAELLDEHQITAWFSFCCRDALHLSDGTALTSILSQLEDQPQIVAVGINCTAPRHVESLIKRARDVSQKPIIVYPNSGETYDAETATWRGTSAPQDFARAASRWRASGAKMIGGCCRTGPSHIAALRSAWPPGRVIDASPQ